MDKMLGVILAGGLGTRLLPSTRVTNKHLLPVYDKPMVLYPIQTLVNAGIDEVLLVTGGQHAGDFLRLLGNGQDLGIRKLHYTYQEGEGGIADALRLAEDVADGGKMCVILGDNLIQRNIKKSVEAFSRQARRPDSTEGSAGRRAIRRRRAGRGADHADHREAREAAYESGRDRHLFL